jgi:peptidoglycan/xylan/chitin deacetylase (PgdA/CDA1 family)
MTLHRYIFRHFLIILFLILAVVSASGTETGFTSLDLSDSNFLLFKIKTDCPGSGSYETLFENNLATGKITQLTVFPEQILYLKQEGLLQIQNRFGVFRTDPGLRNPKALDSFPSFLNSKKIERGKLFPMSTSPDGRYILYTGNLKASFADLFIFDLHDRKEAVMIPSFEVSFEKPLILWSEDSRNIIYSKSGSIYYFSIDQFKQNRVMAEVLRKIGNGNLHNIKWANKDALYYISGHLVYRILTQDFFTRAFYREIFDIGTVLGRIPYEFDPNFDDFWISTKGDKLLLDKGGRNLCLYYLKSDDFPLEGNIFALPYLYLPASTYVKKVIWPQSNLVTILTQSLDKGILQSSVFRLRVPDKEGVAAAFTQLREENVSDMFLSPSESTVVLIKKDKIDIRDYEGWTFKDLVFVSSPLDVVFMDEDELCISGGYSAFRYNMTNKEQSFVSVSQATDYGFSEDGNNIFIRSRAGAYRMSVEGGDWKEAGEYKVRKPNTATKDFRVYFDTSASDSFSNMIMIRNLAKENYATYPIFNTEGIADAEPMPKQEEPYNMKNFSHGSRTRKREVSLVFDVIDSIQGLSIILNTLSEFNLKCTFFINGEAMRRYPGAIREIANSGHESASMFYAYFNMTDSKFSLDKEFIKTGLSNNETAFYTVTGKELSLYWHAPYYFVNTQIMEVSQEMGYVYIGKDIDSMDWATDTGSNITKGVYLSASKLVEKIVADKKPGSIIPINVGIPDGKREDFLFQKLDLLINALLRLGYDIVPVSRLVKDSK